MIHRDMEDFLKSQYWGIIGVLVSAVGLAIAYVQLRRIATNTQSIESAYSEIDAKLRSHDTLSTLSQAVQLIESIKHRIRDRRVDHLLVDLPQMKRAIVTLQSASHARVDGLDLPRHAEVFLNLEIQLLKGNVSFLDENYQDLLSHLAHFELDLMKVQGSLKYVQQ